MTAPILHIVDDDEAVRRSLAMRLESLQQPAATYASAATLLA